MSASPSEAARQAAAARDAELTFVRERARAFAETEIAPFAGEWDRAGALPRAIITRLAELGFLAGPLPREAGGAGLDNEAFVGVYEELGRACSSVRGFLAVHTGLVCQCLHDHGTEAQRRRWLPALAAGARLGCYALTEPEAGSDVAAVSTTAEREGDDWLIRGEKIWITNGGIADLALLFARTGPGPGRDGLTGFVIELPAPGWAAEPLGEEPLGHRAADHARIVLTDLRVPDSNRLGAIGAGFKLAMSALDHGRLGVAAGAVGIARACLDEVLAHARSRRQFGRRLGDFQMVQADIADMSAETEAAAALVRHAAREADRGGPDVTRLTSSAKLFATEVAQRCADKAVLLLGSRGYGSGKPVERYYRDIQGLRIYEGSNPIQRLIIARQLLGKDTSGAALPDSPRLR